MSNWEQSLKLILLQLHEKLLQNSLLTILWSFSIWSKLERWKSLIGGCLMSWLKIKKYIFWSVFSYSTQWTISQHDSDMQWKVDFIQQVVMTCSVAGLEEAPKHFLKPNLHQKKKVMVIVWLSAARLIHYSLQNPSETITSKKYAQQINEMHQKLQYLQTALVNRKMSILFHDNAQPHMAHSTLQKLNKLGYKVLSILPYSPDLLTTNYHFFKNLKNFLQGKHFHNQQNAENAFQEFIKPWSTDFYAAGINKHFSLAKMCWLQWFLFWLIKIYLSLVIMI